MHECWTRGGTLMSRCISCCWVNDLHCKLLFFPLCQVSVKGLLVLSIPSAPHYALWLVGRIPACKSDIHYVHAVAKPKRRRSAAQIFGIGYWRQYYLQFCYDQKLPLFDELRVMFERSKTMLPLPSQMVILCCNVNTLQHWLKYSSFNGALLPRVIASNKPDIKTLTISTILPKNWMVNWVLYLNKLF